MISINTEAALRILVVDDEEDSRDLTEAALLSAGYVDVVTAPSGWEAFRMLDIGGTRNDGPAVDVVLMDIVMPEIDGVEACARIRNDPHYADLPIIMVTSLDDMDSLTNAFVAGATDYVTKPIRRVELVARVRAALRLKQELDRRLERERELLSFVSQWGDRRATLLIDQSTGLFVGEAAEAYLTADCCGDAQEAFSIVALALDSFDAYRAANGEAAARGILTEVGRAMRRLTATIGIVAAAYRNGTIVLVAPEVEAAAARQLGETVRATVSKLRLRNSQSIVSDYITASVAAISGRASSAIDRVKLLTYAISAVKEAAHAGGDRVLALTM